MVNSSSDPAVGYKRPPRSGQFQKGKSGNPGGRRKKSGPIKIDVESILNETFSVSIAGQTQTMSAKEIELRQILKRAVEKSDFKSIAHLLSLFDKHSCVDLPQTSGVIVLPTNKMPSRMARLILQRYGHPDNWKKAHIAWGRKQYLATMTEIERLCEIEGIIP